MPRQSGHRVLDQIHKLLSVCPAAEVQHQRVNIGQLRESAPGVIASRHGMFEAGSKGRRDGEVDQSRDLVERGRIGNLVQKIVLDNLLAYGLALAHAARFFGAAFLATFFTVLALAVGFGAALSAGPS